MKESFTPDSHESEAVFGGTQEELEAIRESFRKYREAEKAKAPERAKEQAEILRDTNRSFIANRERNRAKDKEMSEEEFMIWERDFAESWQRLQDYLRKGDVYDSEREAKLEAPMFFTDREETLHETIEAQAGNYYRKRSNALREAIKASGDSNAEKDERVIDDFVTHVYEHLELKYMTGSEVREKYGDNYHQYDMARTAVHNDTILSLNHLNDLAKKYGTAPFTPRNFWTSNKPMNEQKPDEAQRMRYDRKVVEGYYAAAFSAEVERYEREQKLKS